MLIKEEHTRTNFIDENDVFVGYSSQQCCCENFGWFVTSEEPRAYIDGTELPDVAADGYVFDTAYFETFDSDETFRSKGMAVFRMTKVGENDLYLCLFNEHNGYYSHGFQAKVGGQIWQEGSL